MLRIQKHGGKPVAGHVTMLSISWLNHRFTAVAVHRGVIQGTWVNPERIEGTHHFDALLAEAVQRTGYTGSAVSLLLAHPRLAQQVVELPPVKGETLHKLVGRQAKHQKIFTGEAAWAYQPLPGNKENQRVILHLFPRILLNQLLDACRKHNLHLTGVIPASALLQHQISENTHDKEETVLVAANTHGSTTIVVGRHDGQTYVARSTAGDWAESDRLSVDINRTILYTNQQFGTAVGRIYLFGEGAEDRMNAMAGIVQPQIVLSPVEYTPVYWATEAISLLSEQHPNLVSSEILEAPRRYGFAKAIAAITILLVIAALGFSGWTLLQAKNEAENIATLTKQLERQKSREEALIARDLELKRQAELARIVMDEDSGAVPAFLLAYLGEAVPPDLVVTNLHVRREVGFWKVTIAGTRQAEAQNAAPGEGSRALAQLQERLTGPPFFIKLTTGEGAAENVLPAQLGEKPPEGTSLRDLLIALAQRKRPPAPVVARPTPAAVAAAQNHFQIEGVMR